MMNIVHEYFKQTKKKKIKKLRKSNKKEEKKIKLKIKLMNSEMRKFDPAPSHRQGHILLV